MSTDQKPALRLETDPDSFLIQCLEPGPAPTVHINAGEDISVEIDITRPDAPVSVTVHDIAAATISLCDLFGAITARELIRRATHTGNQHQQVTQEPLAFEPGTAWNGLVAAAHQEWTFYWNPLPLDRSLTALDTVAAAHQNRAFGGSKTAREYAPAALPAASTLQRLLDAGHITDNAVDTVRAALDAVHHHLMPGHPAPETPYTLPLPLSEANRNTILANPTENPGHEPGLILIGSPDWRLTGHGPASTAENTIQVTVHHRNPDAITITIPTKVTKTAAPIPAYQAIITEPHTGTLLAHATLKPTPGGLLRGHALPTRPIQATDHADIRHPDLPGRPESNPEQRTRDRTRREQARHHILQRLTHLHPAGPLPHTLTEHTLTGHLLVSPEAIIDDFDFFLFTLQTQGDPQRVADRSSAQKEIQIHFSDRYTSEEAAGTITVTAVDDALIEVKLNDFSKLGPALLRITFDTPSGLQQVDTPTEINRRGATHDITLPAPGATISAIEVRYARPGAD
jgi:hypothetical protein